MTKNPFINAFTATIYISLVASIMYYGSKFGGPTDSIVVPIAVLSLFVLSAAVMSFVFFCQPVLIYLEGDKQRAVNLFLKTLGIFAAVTAVILYCLFFLSSAR